MRRFFRQLRMGQKTKYSQPIVNGHHHDALCCNALAVVASLGAVAVDEAPAKKVDQHGESFSIRFCRSPNIQVETIFTDSVGSITDVIKNHCLHTARTKVDRRSDSCPILHRLRLAPTQ